MKKFILALGVGLILATNSFAIGPFCGQSRGGLFGFGLFPCLGSQRCTQVQYSQPVVYQSQQCANCPQCNTVQAQQVKEVVYKGQVPVVREVQYCPNGQCPKR